MKKDEGVTIVDDGPAVDPRISLEQARAPLSYAATAVLAGEHTELQLLVQQDASGVFLDVAGVRFGVHNGTIQGRRDVAEALRIVADNIAPGEPNAEPTIGPTWPEAEHRCELTWGKWTFTARCEAVPYAEAVYYKMVIDVHGDSDGGEHGMFGELSTGGMDATPEDAAKEAKRFRPIVTSSHEERDVENDTCDHERTLDLSAIIDAAAAEMRAAMLSELDYTTARDRRRELQTLLARTSFDDKGAGLMFKRTEDYDAFKAALVALGVEVPS